MRRPLFLILFLVVFLPVCRAVEPFEIREGDRVVLLGDALLERENTYGYLETRMHEQFPDRNFTVRNISWAGDTPKGWSRASFDPAEKGMDRLKEAIELTRPTVVFLGYGMAASLQEMTDRAQDPTLNPDPARYGREPMSAARFKKELGELMTMIEKETAGAMSEQAKVAREIASGADFQNKLARPAAPQPGGLKEISRGSSEAKTPGTPPANGKRPEGAPETPDSAAPAGAGAGADGKPRVSPGANLQQPSGLAVAANPAASVGGVRFVLLSPIRHEDLRAQRPGLPDPAPHNALLEQYSKAIEELAQERTLNRSDEDRIRFVKLFGNLGIELEPKGDTTPEAKRLAQEMSAKTIAHFVPNGIHLSDAGNAQMSADIGFSLGWKRMGRGPKPESINPRLRAAVLRKNAVFFHRFRPANLTYLTGFRKHEQGKNAVEIAEFDALVTAADAEIDRLKRGGKSEVGNRKSEESTTTTAARPAANASEPAKAPPTGVGGDSGSQKTSPTGVGGGPGAPQTLPTPVGGVSGGPKEPPTGVGDVSGASKGSPTIVGEVSGRPKVPPTIVGEASGASKAPPTIVGAGSEAQNPDVSPKNAVNRASEAGKSATAVKTGPSAPGKALPKAPLPDFTVLDGYQIELWAENPHLEKPTQMNWDPQGRLWVASSSTYPQVDPQDVAITMAKDEVGRMKDEKGAAAPRSAGNDKIVILEDTDRDGRADKSTVFAEGLLIPTGVVPDLVEKQKAESGKQKSPAQPPSDISAFNSQLSSFSPSACYVAQSTELLHLADTDGDGRADTRRVVFSGFGTEDTHHLIHTLRWGPDGRLYFNQSVYIHSHLETPWGMVRLNAGGVFAYDPRTERVEVFCKGLWNTWGHAWDDWGQSFLTDGAGRDGISWAFPGAVFAPSEGARKTTVSVSPGSYPKFCGLEIVKSPHFPADWQGNAITCDFRAHRIVRFQISDLGSQIEKASAADPNLKSEILNLKSGYVTKELPDLLRTADASFRPIDVRLGPDGALYIADWSNPVINHGEVDFRDPRRDKERGRIWRITKKDTPVVKWEPLVGKKNEALLDALLSKSAWEREQAKRVLVGKGATNIDADLRSWISRHPDFEARLDAKLLEITAFGLKQEIQRFSPHFGQPFAEPRDPRIRAMIARLLGAWLVGNDLNYDRDLAYDGKKDPGLNFELLTRWIIKDPNPRVRLEAMRALARIPTAGNASYVSLAAQKAPDSDPWYEFAAWASINDLAQPWLRLIESSADEGALHPKWAESPETAWIFKSIDPALAGATLAKLVAEKKVPLDGTGPWFELIGAAGGSAELQPLWDSLLVSFAGNCCETDETRALEGKVAFFDKTDTGARAMAAVLAAARTRNLRPAARTHLAGVLFHVEPLRTGAVELAGLWKTPDAPERLPELLGAADLTPELRRTIFRALRAHGSGEARALIENWTAADAPLENRREAVLALAAMDFGKAAPLLPGVLAKFPDENAALPYWRDLLAIKGAPDELAKLFATDGWKDVTKPVRAAREAGKPAAKLLAALGPVTAAPRNYKDYANSARTDGDPVKGEMIYRRANLACVTCHAIGGAGGKVGPDMTSIGASAPLDYIIESIFAPAVKVKEGYNAVSVTMLDGLVVSGVQVRETAAELVVRDAIGKEQSIPKGQIKAKTDIGSIMPAGLVEQLPHREQMDLFHFLGELGKPGPYDASKGNVARFWRLYPGDTAPAPDLVANPGFPGYTLVDGRFTKDLLAESTQFAAAGKDTVLAVAQFQGAGKTRLKLTGASKAWLDGQPLTLTNGEATPDLANGTHTLAVQLDAKALPEVLRAESPDARFLGN